MGVISFQNEIPTELIRLIIFKTIRLIFKTLDNLFVKLSPVPHSFYRVCNCSLPIPFTRGCGLERKKVIFGFFLYVSGTIVQQLHFLTFACCYGFHTHRIDCIVRSEKVTIYCMFFYPSHTKVALPYGVRLFGNNKFVLVNYWFLLDQIFIAISRLLYIHKANYLYLLAVADSNVDSRSRMKGSA